MCKTHHHDSGCWVVAYAVVRALLHGCYGVCNVPVMFWSQFLLHRMWVCWGRFYSKQRFWDDLSDVAARLSLIIPVSSIKTLRYIVLRWCCVTRRRMCPEAERAVFNKDETQWRMQQWVFFHTYCTVYFIIKHWTQVTGFNYSKQMSSILLLTPPACLPAVEMHQTLVTAESTIFSLFLCSSNEFFLF